MANAIHSALSSLSQRDDLTAGQMQAAMRDIMAGTVTPAQIGGLLMALRVKGETVTEITAAASVMRELAARVEVTGETIDTCGTGGDGLGLFNVSTAAAFVVAQAGAKVAKHGNRSVSSKSGSADVLERAGVNLELGPDAVARCIDELNIGFLFAPAHHSATRHAVVPRKELGVKTMFNLLGPITNPAGARYQVLGVYAQRWLQPLAEVLCELGSRHVMVVHAEDGLDEFSLAVPTHYAELKAGEITRGSLVPEDVGIDRHALDPLVVKDAADSLQLIEAALTGEAGPARDMVALNAGAAIYVYGLVDSLQVGVERAQSILATGSAWQRLQDLAALSSRL